MNKPENIKRRLQLQFLKKFKVSLNFQIQGIGLDKNKTEEEQQEAFGKLLEQLHSAEVEETKIRRNKLGSTFYTFEPFVGLNRQQRRNK
jgi:hypothetical protein